MTVNIDTSRRSLLAPGLATDFFELGPCDTEAKLCAEMARLAYVKERARLEEYLARGGFRLLVPFDEGATQGFVAESTSPPGTVALSFRGTEPDDPKDIFADVNFSHTPWPPPSGTGAVHSGFAQALKWDRIASTLPSTAKRLLFTGHSLGAALATLAASLRPPDYLATFGSPLVGDETFARSLEGVVHHRFVACRDVVTRVPPRRFGYAHTGTRRYIDRFGTVLDSADEATIETDRRAAFLEYVPTMLRPSAVRFRGLADHAPVNYVTGLTGARPPSTAH